MATQKEYALITGAGKGLGKAFVTELALRHIDVVLTALPGENLEEFCESLSADYGIKADFIECDLTKDSEITRLVGWVKTNFPINILINNAGIGGTVEFEKADTLQIDNIILLNIRATALLTHQLLPLLRFNKPAWILNVASMASFSPIGYKTVYSASKAFVLYFTRGLYEELRNSGIFVSVVHPGPMTTTIDSIQRIQKQGRLGKMCALSAQYTAHRTIERLFTRHTHILVGKGNRFNWILTKVVPLRIRLPLITRIIKREIKTSKMAVKHYEDIGYRS